jgi:hypothetical protein
MRCDRCGKETQTQTMSWFNTDMICMECSDAESKRPDFQKAKAAERQAVLNGDYNFPGIGLKE